MAEAVSRTPVSVRPQSRPYEEYASQQQRVLACRSNANNKEIADGPKLWRQMMFGFTCAGFVGLIMLVLGTVFIAEAIGKQQPITVMLCVMGIVFGIIIVVGTVILARLLISRKWLRCQGNHTHPPTSQCFHTCSVIYSPSLDQIANSDTGVNEPPPAYELISSAIPLHHVVVMETHGYPSVSDQPLQEDAETVMVLPPKYDEVSKPLPEYCEEFLPLDGAEKESGEEFFPFAEAAGKEMDEVVPLDRAHKESGDHV